MSIEGVMDSIGLVSTDIESLGLAIISVAVVVFLFRWIKGSFF